MAGVVESGHDTDRQGNSVDTLKLTAQVVKFLGSRRDEKAQAGDEAEGGEVVGGEIPEIPF